MGYPKNSTGNLFIFSLLLAGLLLWSSSISNSKPFFHFQNDHCLPQTNSSMQYSLVNVGPKDELETALSDASMENNTVIIAMVNKAYVEGDVGKKMLDLFIESFWVGEDTRKLLDHLLLVTVDQAAYDRCKFLRLHCYRLVTDGVDFEGEQLYMSSDFIKMMWSRTLFLSNVLNHGYNFIFTDTDVLWLRNPLTRIGNNASEDLELSTDLFNGDSRSEHNFINTGFYYIRSNNRTMALFDKWYGMKDNSTGQKEQDVLAGLIREGVFRQLGIRVRFLDTLFFSGFCKDSKDIWAVATVHANCCRSISAKVTDLTAVLHDWKRFKATYAIRFRWSKHIGCINSWRVSNTTL